MSRFFSELLLRIRRELDLEPPADGLCHFERKVEVRTTFGTEFREFIEVMRCKGTWHHDGAHYGDVVEIAS